MNKEHCASVSPRSAIWRRLADEAEAAGREAESKNMLVTAASLMSEARTLRACASEFALKGAAEYQNKADTKATEPSDEATPSTQSVPDLREFQQAADFLRTEGFGGWANDVESAIHHLGAVLRACAEAPAPRGVTISATEAEVEFLALAAGLRAQSVEEYVKRAINAALCKQGVDAVLFRESDDD